jgi:hypothetical protein
VTDYFDALETELRTAVPRAARRRWRPSLPHATAGRIGLAVLVAAPVAVAVLALVLLGRGPSVATHSVQSGGAAAGPAVAGSPRIRRAPLRLYGDGVTGAHFGAALGDVVTALSPRFGRPSTMRSSEDCGIGLQLTWPLVLDPRTGHLVRDEEMTVDFHRGHFVGYQFGGPDPRVHGRHIVSALAVTTARGLRVGDLLARGRRLYGPAFHLSNAQGGSWSVRTPRGELDGYALVNGRRLGPLATVETIDAGNVGCPAVSP